MRPLRFTIFVATTTGLLALAVYLWTPLIVANLPNTRLARPPVASNSVASVEARAGMLRPPPLRPARTEPPHRKQPPALDRGPALKVLPLARPAVSLATGTVKLPVAASGVSTPTISPGARLEHPASPAPAPALPAPPSSSQPDQQAPPSLPTPAPAGKPKPAPAVKPRPVPSPTAPSAAQPNPQPPPAAAAPEADSPAQLAATTRQTSAASPPDAGGQTPPLATPKIWLGYADTYSPRGTGLPSIWNGSPGVIFVGCGVNPDEDGPAALDICPQETSGPPGDSFDAGAIRIDNTSAAGSLVVTGPASVAIGTCVYTPWPGLKRTIPPGGTLILTQTGLSEDPCGQNLGGNYNFDTSESSGNGNCNPSASVPVITLTINGSPTTIDDGAQILNTHGIDKGACTGENEFEDWTPAP